MPVSFGIRDYIIAHYCILVKHLGILHLPYLASQTAFVRQRHAGKVDGMEISQQSKIPIPEFRKLLGPVASNLSDFEIEHLRDLEDRLADIIFDSWLRNRNSQPEVAKLSEN